MLHNKAHLIDRARYEWIWLIENANDLWEWRKTKYLRIKARRIMKIVVSCNVESLEIKTDKQKEILI